MKDAQRALEAWFGPLPCRVAPLGNGHIHATWEVLCREGRFVLQALNQQVFASPETVLANQAALGAVLAGAPDWSLETPRAILTREGGRAAVRGERWWRLTQYIGPGRTLERLPSAVMSSGAAAAFAGFARALAPLTRTDRLQPVIPGFHQLDGYLSGFDEAWRMAASARRDQALYAALIARRSRYLAAPRLPDEVIHADCKVNNLRFAARGEAVIGVLDLDTVMVGQWWWDFGDLVRTLTPGWPDWAAGFAGLADGYFGGRDALTPAEMDAARQAPAHMSYMLCVRFFTDHLAGDRYFRISRPGDNLRRARAQLAALVKLEAAPRQAAMAAALAKFAFSQSPS